MSHPRECDRLRQELAGARKQAKDLAAALDLSVREIEGLVGRALDLSQGAAMSGAGIAGRLALADYRDAAGITEGPKL